MATAMRNRTLLLADAGLLFLASIVAFAVRFESIADLQQHIPDATAYLILTLPVRLGVFWKAGVYRRLWRYAGRDDLMSLVGAAGLAAFFNLVLGAFFIRAVGISVGRVPLAVLALDGAMTLGLPALLRLSTRDRDRRQGRRASEGASRGRPVLIAGAGAAGRMIVAELRQNPNLRINPLGFVDDAVEKQGKLLSGLPILGTLADLESAVRATGAVEVIVAMPTAPGTVVRAIAESAQRIGIATRTLPGLFELVSGRVSVTALRKLEISDLLRREPIKTDLAAVRAIATGRRILITGAGGSIGSELCRQLADLAPGRLGLLGHGENSIFEIQAELRRRFPEIPCDAIICDVRDRERLRITFETFRPEVIFHAAAHKHVGLMERNPEEAITNNVIGTRNVAELAGEFAAQRFVLISTDKAVRPTSVMGASKRIAEQIVQELAPRTKTNYTTVRFGNVLGSRGSVVPIFLQQIRAGGPVTITHPEVRRYFMTIPEAVQLVLQAAVIGEGSEVFALDMGEPVKILDLAHDMIRLSGLVPEQDIAVVFTGLKPGEKLYEEVFFDPSLTEPTTHPKVLRARMRPHSPVLLHSVDGLADLAMAGVDRDILRRAIQRLVPDYAQDDLPVLYVPPEAQSVS
ncbi:MAG: nucleoside-diphosphate sugar epimerase/dehydratase [Gemmatimonadota bacterium]